MGAVGERRRENGTASEKREPTGLLQRAGQSQRLAMYMVISKPKRMSLAAGFSHFMQILLIQFIPQVAVKSTGRLSACTWFSMHLFNLAVTRVTP